MAEQPQESSDKNVEIWKIKKLIKSLELARGFARWICFRFPYRLSSSLIRNGTSMISLITPPRDQIPRIAKMLADEYGTASNIKSRVNRLSVLSAITSVQARLKLYNKGITIRSAILSLLMIKMDLCSTEQWTGDLLWNDRHRRWQREKSQYRFRTFQAHQYIALPVWQQVSHRGEFWGICNRQSEGVWGGDIRVVPGAIVSSDWVR